MKIQNIILLGMFSLTCWSCGEKEEKVTPEGYEALQQEQMQLKEENDAHKQQVVKQAMLINETLRKLASISAQTAVLRQDIEAHKGKYTQAEQLSRFIAAIKEEVSQLEEQAADPQAKQIIQNMETVIADKEAEIARLKEIVESKDLTLKGQYSEMVRQNKELGSQLEIINGQQDVMRKSYDKQTNLLYTAGKDLEDLADLCPQEISRKKNRRKVNAWRAKMYREAIIYYQEAARYGKPTQAEIQRVRSAISRLDV